MFLHPPEQVPEQAPWQLLRQLPLQPEQPLEVLPLPQVVHVLEVLPPPHVVQVLEVLPPVQDEQAQLDGLQIPVSAAARPNSPPKSQCSPSGQSALLVHSPSSSPQPLIFRPRNEMAESVAADTFKNSRRLSSCPPSSRCGLSLIGSLPPQVSNLNHIDNG